jgi:Fe-S-cluster-containing hydrogenase component 2
MDAIFQKDNGLPVIDESKCAGCMYCVDYCPMKAVHQN